MRNKTDFYRLFFEQLARRGFDVKRSQSSDYIADIYFKNQLVAYFSKADTVIQNPFVTVKDKLIRLINDTAQDTANKAGICRDCPYTDANEKLPNGSYKLAEYNGVTLACKEHHLFGYVFSTYRTAPDSGEMMARQIFYNKEFAGQDFAKEYLAHPIGLDVGQYVADLMKYCPEHIVDQVMEHQDALLRRLGTDYLTVIAYMPYEEDGGTKYA